MRTQLKLFLALTAILMFIQIAHATEITARVKNYDRWKDLPGETLFNMVNEFWPANKEDSALICCLILSNPKFFLPDYVENPKILRVRCSAHVHSYKQILDKSGRNDFFCKFINLKIIFSVHFMELVQDKGFFVGKSE